MVRPTQHLLPNRKRRVMAKLDLKITVRSVGRDELAMWLVNNGMAEDRAGSTDAEEKADLLLSSYAVLELGQS